MKLTRRALLARGATAGAGLVLAGGVGAAARSVGNADLAALGEALAVERASAETYAQLARASQGSTARLAGRIAAAEARHAQALRAAGALERGIAVPGLASFDGPAAALEHEARSASAYVELLPRLRTPALRELVGFILAEEAAHAAALRAALGQDPVAGAFL